MITVNIFAIFLQNIYLFFHILQILLPSFIINHNYSLCNYAKLLQSLSLPALPDRNIVSIPPRPVVCLLFTIAHAILTLTGTGYFKPYGHGCGWYPPILYNEF